MKIEIEGKTLTFSHTNDFDNGYVHHLFSLGSFLYWVEVDNGVVLSISPTLKEEAEMWEWWKKHFPKAEFAEHTAFCDVLEKPENLKKFQELLG